MTRTFSVLALSACLVAPLGAQGSRGDEVPASYMPPPGMCRVWVDGVPPAQQPAPTDCQAAMKSHSSRARVIFGERVVPPSAGAWMNQELPVNPSQSAAGLAGRGRPFADADENRNLRGELCLDTNHDGYCDDSAPGIAGCVDANRDGKCDDARREVPALIEAGFFRAGSAVGGVCIDRNRDGKCDETWLAADICVDRDMDGKCDTPLATLVKPAEPATVKPEPAPAPEKPRSARSRKPEKPE
ncbi:MAG: hypothetical protein HY275_08935 [Gemmatimonadetes bacterium]|nr:hypothetical protein [Gemmatimonadota bacterium]